MRKQIATNFVVICAAATVIGAAISTASNRESSSVAAPEKIAAQHVQLDATKAADHDNEQPVPSSDADRAGRAALKAVGEGRVLDVDRDLEGGATWEVEIVMNDGTLADVLLDDQFRVLSIGGEQEPGERSDDSREDDRDDD